MLRPEKVKDEYLESKDRTFIGVELNGIYIVEVVPDAAEEAKIERKVYVAPKKEDKKTSASAQITNELKNMSLDELKEKGDKYKELLEARELEDCLFS